MASEKPEKQEKQEKDWLFGKNMIGAPNLGWLSNLVAPETWLPAAESRERSDTDKATEAGANSERKEPSKPRDERWMKNEESENCLLCDQVFTFTNRRHHCRNCFKLVCSACSSRTCELGVAGSRSGRMAKQRVCDECHAQLEATKDIETAPWSTPNLDPNTHMQVRICIESITACEAIENSIVKMAVKSPASQAKEAQKKLEEARRTGKKVEEAPKEPPQKGSFYCVLTVARKQVGRTRTVDPSKPDFGEKFVCRVCLTCRAASYALVELYERRVTMKNSDLLIGHCRVPIYNIPEDTTTDYWYKLHHPTALAMCVGRVRVVVERGKGGALPRPLLNLALPLVDADVAKQIAAKEGLDRVRLDEFYPPGHVIHNKLYLKVRASQDNLPDIYVPRNECILEAFAHARMRITNGAQGIPGLGNFNVSVPWYTGAFVLTTHRVIFLVTDTSPGTSENTTLSSSYTQTTPLSRVNSGAEEIFSGDTPTSNLRIDTSNPVDALLSSSLGKGSEGSVEEETIMVESPDACVTDTLSSTTPLTWAEIIGDCEVMEAPISTVIETRVKRRWREHLAVIEIRCRDNKVFNVGVAEGKMLEENIHHMQAMQRVESEIEWLRREDQFARAGECTRISSTHTYTHTNVQTDIRTVLSMLSLPAVPVRRLSKKESKVEDVPVEKLPEEGVKREVPNVPIEVLSEEEITVEVPDAPVEMISEEGVKVEVPNVPVEPSEEGIKVEVPEVPEKQLTAEGDTETVPPDVPKGLLPAEGEKAEDVPEEQLSEGNNGEVPHEPEKQLPAEGDAKKVVEDYNAPQEYMRVFGNSNKTADYDRWRIDDTNKDYGLCSTYPSWLVVPTISYTIKRCRRWRAHSRIPVLTWLHMCTGAPLLRSSQPIIGISSLVGRGECPEDEELLGDIREAAREGPSPPPRPRMTPNLVANIVVNTILNKIDTHKTHTENDSTCVHNMDTHADSSACIHMPKPCPKECEAAKERVNPRLHIIDARPVLNAKGHSLLGRGHEIVSRLGGEAQTTLEFMDIANIHVMRESLSQLQIAARAPDGSQWYQAVYDSNWLFHVKSILKGASLIAQKLEIGDPVLVHCSDGWDRTSQLCSLAELQLDPYYRTLDGFRVLICKDWLSFGHQFCARAGYATVDPSDAAPIFGQFLDAVYQVVRQFPTEFEFGESLLLLLLQACTSRFFDDFLCNCERERRRMLYWSQRLGEEYQSFSLWDHVMLEKHIYINKLYKLSDTHTYRLSPDCDIRALGVWTRAYAAEPTRPNGNFAPSIGEDLLMNLYNMRT